jgi:hydroxymethylglutaryl-CoA lyase
MASTSEVFQSIISRPPEAPHPIAYNYLGPNVRGIETLVRLLDSHQTSRSSEDSEQAPITSSKDPNELPSHDPLPNSSQNSTEISLFAAATETFSNKNTNCSIQESLDRCKPILAIAKDKGIRARGYVSVALGCPYEGPDVDPHKVAEMTATLLEMGCDEVSVADTTGMGTAPRTQRLLKTLKEAGIQNEDIALHFHDTYGQALVNTVVGLEHGIRTFDSSVGGLGGCPFSKGATGNVSTEDLLHLLHSLGIHTGVNLEKMAEIGAWISGELGRKNDSRAGKAILARKQA